MIFITEEENGYKRLRRNIHKSRIFGLEINDLCQSTKYIKNQVKYEPSIELEKKSKHTAELLMFVPKHVAAACPLLKKSWT